MLDTSHPVVTGRPMTAVVCGAGPGGQAAAVLLGRLGIEVTLLERVADPRAVGAALLLQPNGLAVLDAIGIGDELRRWGHGISAVAISDGRGRSLARTPVPDLGPGTDRVVAVLRSDLAELLDDAVAATPAITVLAGAEVVDASPDGRVTWQGAGGGGAIVADLVVGADGVHSVVRARASFGARRSATGFRYLRALLPAVDGVEAGEHWTRLGLIGCSPVGWRMYVYADATARPVAAALAGGDRAALRRAWSAAAPALAPVLAGLDDDVELLVNDVDVVRCDHFVDGRIALIGDAAHAMAPTLGQGANSALLDAAVLAVEVARAEELGGALRSYDARRRGPVQRVQREAALAARLARPGSPLWTSARDALLRLTARSAGTRRFARAQQAEPGVLRTELGALTVVA